jgi:HSP20 family protein
MPLVKFNPFETFSDSVDRLLSNAQVLPWSPAVDIFETENELVLKGDVPGVDMNDIDIQIENGTLSLKGERKFEDHQKEKGFHRVERRYGAFARYFTLPDTLEADKVRADYKNGVLTITLPKKELAKPRQIKVEINNN